MKCTLFILSLLCAMGSYAQKSAKNDWEVGIIGGIGWYNGDLNTNKFFGSDYYREGFGLSVRKNLNERFDLRGTFIYGVLSAHDKHSNSAFQQNRNLSFYTRLYEIGSTIEFNFFEYDEMIDSKRFSPYSFIGISAFYFNPITEVEGSVYELRPLTTENRSYSRVSVAIPFGFGFKWAITDRIITNIDWGMRYTFTDYLDDVSDEYPQANELDGLSQNLSDRSLEQSGPDGTNWGTQRGNPQTRDWYSFVMAGLSFRLGPKKGSCKHIGI